MIKHVQFLDNKKLVVVSVFCGEQDPSTIQFLGVVEDTDQRYLDFLDKLAFKAS